MTWIFGSFLVTPCVLTSCHAVRSYQRYDSTSGHLGTTGVQPEGDHVMRSTRSVLDRGRESELSVGHATDQRCLSLQGGCKRSHPQAPGRRYGKNKSSLWVYVSLSISQLTTNSGPFSRIKWKIYFYKEVCFVRSFNCVNRGYATSACLSVCLSHSLSLSTLAPDKFSKLHLVSMLDWCKWILTGQPTLSRPCFGVHRRTSLMISSFLLQQCRTCIPCLFCVVLEIGGKWP